MKEELKNRGWYEVTFSDVTRHLKRGPFGGSLKKEFFVQNGYKVYEQQHAIKKDFSLGSYFVDQKKFDELKGFIVGPGDYIISCSGTIGRIYRLPNSAPIGIINQALLRISLDDRLLNHAYFSFLFQSEYFQRQILSETRGTGMQNLAGMKEMKLVPVFLPSLPEQRAIVARIEELFSELDHSIVNLKSAQSKLEIYRQAVLKKAFEGGFTEEWRRNKNIKSGESVLSIVEKEKVSRFGDELKQWENEIRLWKVTDKKGSKPIKPTQPKSIGKLSHNELSELPGIPSCWKWVKNNELLYYVTSGSRDWKQFYSENEGVFFIRTQDINTNKLNLENAAFVNLPSNVEGKRSLVVKGDLLMTITGANVGKVAAIDFDIPEAYVSQSVALMKYVLPEMAAFLHYYFQASSAGAKYVGAMVYGVGRPVLSLENIREAPVPLCSLEEQAQIVQEIESRLSVADKLSETIQTNLLKSESLRQSILKQAFEGKLLTVTDLEACRKESDWEPAEKLLERIKQEKSKPKK